MKKRFSLFNDTDNEPISIGLARLVKFLPNIPHQYIYQGDSYPPSPPQIIYLFL